MLHDMSAAGVVGGSCALVGHADDSISFSTGQTRVPAAGFESGVRQQMAMGKFDAVCSRDVRGVQMQAGGFEQRMAQMQTRRMEQRGIVQQEHERQRIENNVRRCQDVERHRQQMTQFEAVRQEGGRQMEWPMTQQVVSMHRQNEHGSVHALEQQTHHHGGQAFGHNLGSLDAHRVDAEQHRRMQQHHLHVQYHMRQQSDHLQNPSNVQQQHKQPPTPSHAHRQDQSTHPHTDPAFSHLRTTIAPQVAPEFQDSRTPPVSKPVEHKMQARTILPQRREAVHISPAPSPQPQLQYRHQSPPTDATVPSMPSSPSPPDESPFEVQDDRSSTRSFQEFAGTVNEEGSPAPRRDSYVVEASTDDNTRPVKRGRNASPLICTHCPEQFPDRESRKAHVRTVHARRFVCSVCSSRFTRRFDLDKHSLTVHEGRRPFKCDICMQAFGQKHHMVRHKRTVHGRVREFVCDICQSRFARKEHMFNHKKSVHDEHKPFLCFLCDVELCDKGALKRHLEETHSVKNTRSMLLAGWQPNSKSAPPQLPELLQL